MLLLGSERQVERRRRGSCMLAGFWELTRRLGMDGDMRQDMIQTDD